MDSIDKESESEVEEYQDATEEQSTGETSVDTQQK
jgi:hypothetical protein